MKFELVVSWKMTANILVEADSYEDAEELVKDRASDLPDADGESAPIPLYVSYGPEYFGDSFEVEGESGNDPSKHPDESFLR